MTASVFHEHRQEAINAGADDFISKPFREEVLFEKIQALLGVHYQYAEEAAPRRSQRPVCRTQRCAARWTALPGNSSPSCARQPSARTWNASSNCPSKPGSTAPESRKRSAGSLRASRTRTCSLCLENGKEA